MNLIRLEPFWEIPKAKLNLNGFKSLMGPKGFPRPLFRDLRSSNETFDIISKSVHGKTTTLQVVKLTRFHSFADVFGILS